MTNRDTWTTRDYPVLCAVADSLDEHGVPVDASRISGMDQDDVRRAMVALIDGDHLRGKINRRADGRVHYVSAATLTEKGRRAAGLWPAEDSPTQALVDAILAAAEQVDDEDERTRLQKAADALRAGSGRVLEGAVSAVIAGVVGGSL